MTEKKSIAILGTRGIPAQYGGFETFAEELSLRLINHNIAVTVYCDSAEEYGLSSYKGVSLVYLSSPDLGPFTTIWFDLHCLWHARKGHNVVYMLGYGAAWACFIPRLWGAKVWLNVDGVEWARAKWGRMAKAYFKMMEFCSMWTPNRIIADATGIKNHLSSRHKRMPPCSVIPYGAPLVESVPDDTILKEWSLMPGQYYLVVARIEPENHVLEIIEGYEYANTLIPLIIVGNHDIETAYAQALKRHMSSMIRFIGGVYDKAKLQALRSFSLAYFHGHSVGGTNPSLLEALGCGNLVIAHSNIYNREVIGEIGYYFDKPVDIPSIITSIESLSAEARSSIGNQARDRIREKYDWDIITNSYLHILNENI